MILSIEHEYMLRMRKKLNNPSTTPELHWSILKGLLNNKEIPCVTPFFNSNIKLQREDQFI